MTEPLVLYPSATKVLIALDKLELEVETASTLEQIREIEMKTRAIQAAGKNIKAVADRAGRVRVEAAARLGAELERMGTAKGTRGQLRGKPKGSGSSGGAKVEPPDEQTPKIETLGVTKKESAAFKKLAAIPRDERRDITDKLANQGKPISPSTVLQATRQQAKVEKKHDISQAIFSADGPFGTVVIDPPWKVSKIDRDERPNQDAFDYPTMAVEEIASFFTREVTPKLEHDCHLFMWTTQKWLPSALHILDQIGFKYVLVMVWHKTGGFQPVEMPQYNCEFVVYARRGSPLFISTKDFPCCFEGERREHSRKPDRFYDIVRRVTGGSRIDVFSREARDGFAQYGNEIGRFTEAA